MDFYALKAKTINGKEFPFEELKGKVVIIVNTASKCGFTPQFEGLEKLYQKYKNQGLEILGFPCNQFGSQDPGSEEEIEEFCQVNYGVSFQMFAKVEVNGKNAHPVFKFLKKEKGSLLGSSIKWNFTKFLVNPEGQVEERYAPTSTPEKMEDKIKDLLLEATAS